MNQREYEEKRLKLGRYLLVSSRAARREEECALWRSRAQKIASMKTDYVGKRNFAPGMGADFCGANDIADKIQKEYVNLYSEAAQLRERLNSAIDSIDNPVFRDVLDRAYIKGQSIENIAVELDRSVKTIKRMMRKATEDLAAASSFFNEEP